MTKSFEFLSDLSDFARSHGLKLVNSSVSDRRNKRGFYDYIEVSFLNPIESPSAETETMPGKKSEKNYEVN